MRDWNIPLSSLLWLVGSALRHTLIEWRGVSVSFRVCLSASTAGGERAQLNAHVLPPRPTTRSDTIFCLLSHKPQQLFSSHLQGKWPFCPVLQWMSSTDVHIFIEQQSPLKTHCLLLKLIFLLDLCHCCFLFQKLCLF